MSGKSYKGVVSENVEKEYKSFFEDEMKKSKEEIFYDNYRIHFYVELRDFLMSDNDLDDEYYEKLASEKDSLLALLYDDFLDKEYSSINNWEDTTDFLESYCERYYEKPMLREGQNLNKTIYSTDADALEKLEARLEEQEKKYAEMKKLNKYFRENCTVKGYPGIDDEKAAKIDERISNAYSWCKAPYPQYEMQSMSQKIRATKERIKSLETEQTREETEYDTDGLGFDVVENKEIARLQIIYPGGGRVDNETYKRLRENGFVFSRTNGAFQRQLNENSRYAVRRFIQSQRNVVEQMSTRKETEAEM